MRGCPVPFSEQVEVSLTQPVGGHEEGASERFSESFFDRPALVAIQIEHL